LGDRFEWGFRQVLVERRPLNRFETGLLDEFTDLGHSHSVHKIGFSVDGLFKQRAAKVVSAPVERDLTGLLAF
jgi:hypothetical protein